MNLWVVKKIRAAFWFAGLVLLLSALILVGNLSTNSLDFSRYNTGWNGTSQFFSDLDRHRVVEISDSTQLTAYPANATLLIIAPYRQPTTGELAAYHAFIERGNTIILADDFGTGNAILRGIGSRISILPGNVSSIDREYADSYSAVAYRSANVTPVQNIQKILLNRAAPLEGGKTLVRTSSMSWIDENGDRRINNNEQMGSFAVIAADEIGNGRLIVISDPSIFINSMYAEDARWDNRLLINNLVGGDGAILVDGTNSRTRNAEGLNEILHVIRTTLLIELVLFGVLML
ncbi:MAG: DUF4350 domain-containing protein, partial [Methanoregula sp.]|nr:DUF4350 domain-containing protein [Methanoregula sp.]